MSSSDNVSCVVHVINAGNCERFRGYLSNFGSDLDLDNLDNSVKTPGYIISGEVTDKFPPAHIGGGLYRCAFVIQPVNSSEVLHVFINTQCPKDLGDVQRHSFVALFNPQYFVGARGRKTFSLGPGHFVLWYSKPFVKTTKKRLATSPVKSHASNAKSLKLSLQQNQPSRKDSSLPTETAGCDSGFSRGRHCARSACSGYHHRCSAQQPSCHRQIGQSCGCNRQCCNHRSSLFHGCGSAHSCHQCEPRPCASHCTCHIHSSRCCNDPRDVALHSTCCSKNSHREAPSCCHHSEGTCQRRERCITTEETSTTRRKPLGGSRADSSWYLRSWMKHAASENEGTQEPVFPTQATCGEDREAEDVEDDTWTSVSQQIVSRSRARQHHLGSPGEHGLAGPSHRLDLLKTHPNDVKHAGSDLAIEKGTSDRGGSYAGTAKTLSSSKLEHPGTQPSPARQETHNQVQEKLLQTSPPIAGADVSDSQKSLSETISKRTNYNKGGLEPTKGNGTLCQTRTTNTIDTPEVVQVTQPNVGSLTPSRADGITSSVHFDAPKEIWNVPSHKASIKPVQKRPVLPVETDSDDSDISSLFWGKTQSLLCEEPSNAREKEEPNNACEKEEPYREKEVPKTQIPSDNVPIPEREASCDDVPRQPNDNNALHDDSSGENPVERVEDYDTGTFQDTLQLPKNPTVEESASVAAPHRKRLRRLFNPANSSWFFDQRNPSELVPSSVEPAAKVSGTVVVESAPDLPPEAAKPKDCTGAKDNQHDVAKKTSGSAVKDDTGQPSASGGVKADSTDLVAETSQDSDEVIPPSDVELPRKGSSTKVPIVYNLQTLADDWSSDCSSDRRQSSSEPSSEPPRKPSGSISLANTSKALCSFTALHTPSITDVGVRGSVVSLESPSKETHVNVESTDNRTVEPSTVSKIPSSQHLPDKAINIDNKVAESGNSNAADASKTSVFQDPENCETLVDKSRAVHSPDGTVADELGLSRSFSLPCQSVNDLLAILEMDAADGNRSLACLENPERTEVSAGEIQVSSGVPEGDPTACSEPPVKPEDRPVPDRTSGLLESASIPAKAGSVPTELILRITDSESTSANETKSAVTQPNVTSHCSDLPVKPEDRPVPDMTSGLLETASIPAKAGSVPTELILRISDSESMSANETKSITQPDVTSPGADALQPPCSPTPTVFYDAEDDEEPNEGASHVRQGSPAEAKASPASDEDDELSRKLTLPDQVFGVFVTIVDLRPCVTLETNTDIVKGVCNKGCGSTFDYKTAISGKMVRRSCSNCSLRLHHLCPECKKTGTRRPLCLQFVFEIHALIGSHKCLRLQVELEDAVEFLGITPKQYLKDSSETLRSLADLCDSDEKKRRLQGQAFIRTEDRNGEVVPLLTDTRLCEFTLSKLPM